MRWLRPIALAILAALRPVAAQEASEKLERLEVTGSRIATSSDIDTTSPVAIIKAEEIRMEGFLALELILNNFPQLVGDQGNRVSNGATGTATANLRGLGAQRTLVLVNGRRLPSGDPQALAPDLNQIPPALIQRVEILTGGASAVYGSDAIAGVVNFILNDRFEGVQGDVAYDFYGHKQKSPAADAVRARGYELPGDKWRDGATTATTLTMGGNFAAEKGNAVVSMRYYKSEALLQSQRDYSACALVSSADGLLCGGSPVANPGRVFGRGFFGPDASIDPRPSMGWTLDASGRVRVYVRGANDYNFAPLNYYQRPAERYGVNAFSNYALSPEAKVYFEFGFHDDRTVAQIAPSGLFGLEAHVRYENPLLNDDWRSHLIFRKPDGTVATGPGTTADVFVFRRDTEGGGRQDDRRHTSFREVLGLKGAIAGKVDYDFYFQTSKVIYQEQYRHDVSIFRAVRALDVVADPATGAPTCASALNGTDPNCVPYNLWSLGGVSAAATAYLETAGMQRALTSQQVVGGTVSANLADYGIRIPGSSGDVELVMGLERRAEKLAFENDVEFSTGDLAGWGQPIQDVRGSFEVREFFGEARVPVLDLLQASGSFRHSSYSAGKTTDTFGVGFNATPATFLRVRGSYQRAVRAANLNELFAPQVPGSYDWPDGDPCAGPTPTRSAADCQRTGLAPALYGRLIERPFLEYPSTEGGNPDLRPETAKTSTLGIVLTLTRNLVATLDYFDIRLEDTISSIGAAAIFQQCIDTGNPTFCRLVTRDAASGALWLGRGGILNINQNIGRTRVSGADVSTNYRLKLAGGHSVAFDAIGTYLRRWNVERFPGAPAGECVGFFFSSCFDPPAPKWRHRARATWQAPWDFEISGTWRHLNSTKSFVDGARIAAVSYFDLAASWNPAKNVTVRAGINNVADRDPPLVIGGSANGNTFVQTYDALGRHVFVALTARF